MIFGFSGAECFPMVYNMNDFVAQIFSHSYASMLVLSALELPTIIMDPKIIPVINRVEVFLC